MAEQPAPKSAWTRIAIYGLAALVIVVVAAGVVWTSTCPCEATPGFVLLGDVQDTPVADWRFANDVPLCQIQIQVGWRPHAVNLNCMATPSGELFLSCSVCTRKHWAGQVAQNEPSRTAARLRLDGRLYPVTLNRVLDPAQLDRAWAARVKKLQVHGGGPINPKPDPDAPRPDHWWSFRVVSR